MQLEFEIFPYAKKIRKCRSTIIFKRPFQFFTCYKEIINEDKWGFGGGHAYKKKRHFTGVQKHNELFLFIIIKTQTAAPKTRPDFRHLEGRVLAHKAIINT